MDDHPETLELFDVSVDGRDVHVRRPDLNRFGELFDAQVIVRVEEHLQEDPSRRGRPSAPSADQGEDVIDRREADLAAIVRRQ